MTEHSYSAGRVKELVEDQEMTRAVGPLPSALPRENDTPSNFKASLSSRVTILDRRNSEDRQLLDRIASENPYSTIYHTSEWWDVLESVFGFTTRYILVGDFDSSHCLLPLANVKNILMGNRLVSLPMSQFGGPIYNSGEALKDAIKFAIQGRSKSSEVIVIKARQQLSSEADELLDRHDYYLDYWINLSKRSQDDLWKEKSRKTFRWNVRKAERSNVNVQRSPSLRERDQLYKVMLHTTNRHSVPPYPHALIEFVAEKMTRSSNIYVARLDEKVIAGIIVFNHAKTSYFAYSFALDKYLPTGAISLLLWDAICDSHEVGNDYFDLGIVSPRDKGLQQFKRHFGAIETSLPFYHYSGEFDRLVSDPNTSFRYAQSIWKHLPSPLQIRLAPSLLRAFG
jgi:serine/alanine adding enzyme